MSEKFTVISLGWGVQSFTMAAMSSLGELPHVDVAVHADTTHEREDTYKFAEKYTLWLEDHGINVATVLPKSAHVNGKYHDVKIPAFTKNEESSGQIRRHCTFDWKIATLRRYMQQNREKKPVDLWIGISTDEAMRMRPSDVKYITHRWPLIEKRMNRAACVQWLINHGIEVPPKSACVFCPYHDTRAWQELKSRGGVDWEKAVEIDTAIRKTRPPYDLFIHPARIPLAEIDLRTDAERGQMSLWDEECSGLCGV